MLSAAEQHTMSSLQQFVVGVDVGTGSARAGLFDLHGRRQAVAAAPIQMWQPQADWAEQSSDDIWSAVGIVVRQVVAREQGVGAGAGGRAGV